MKRILFAAALAFWLAPSLGAQRTSTLRLTGLRQPVEVLRDPWGVAHIYAKNQHDLFFAQGYVAASDRLFQMELWKRTGQGRLAEVVGSSAVKRDINARLLRYRGPMAAEYANYAPDARAILEAFTAGINAYIDSHNRNLPQEFRIAGFAPEHWKPEDCLSRNAAFTMTNNAGSELYHAQLISALGVEKAQSLLTLDPPVKLDPERRANYAGLSPSLLNEIVSSDHRIEFPAPESNNWTIAGRVTASGRPIVANDPHRAITLPSLRYIVHLVAPGWDVIGAGEPALPGVALGHNQRIAWGFTIFGIDQQDLFLEQLDSRNPQLYKTERGWARMKVVREVIHVRGAHEVIAQLKFTRHGPVLWEDAASHRALALRWVGAEPGSAGYLASLSVDRAQNWNDFRSALRRWKLPSENFVYGDVEGNIGEQSAGWAPRRQPPWTGLLPVSGSSKRAWQGWRSLDELPHTFNPSAGFVATANHKMIADDERHPVSYHWDPAYRYQRISEFISQARDSAHKLTMDDISALQTDVTSLVARTWQQRLFQVAASEAGTDAAVKMILDWDARLTADSPAAALYEVWRAKLDQIAIVRSVPPAMRETIAGAWEPQQTIAFFSASHDGKSGPRVSDLEQMMWNALHDSWQELASEQPGDPAQWSWGKLHQVRFRHSLDALPAAKSWDLGPFPRPGDEYTVNSTGGPGFSQAEGASFRELLDVGAWDNSLAVSAPGQSGEPASAHYADLLPLWLEGKYFPLLYSRAAVEKNARNTLRLLPKQ